MSVVTQPGTLPGTQPDTQTELLEPEVRDREWVRVPGSDGGMPDRIDAIPETAAAGKVTAGAVATGAVAAAVTKGR